MFPNLIWLTCAHVDVLFNVLDIGKPPTQHGSQCPFEDEILSKRQSSSIDAFQKDVLEAFPKQLVKIKSTKGWKQQDP